MGGFDTRDPFAIAQQLTQQLKNRWQHCPIDKPVLIIIQGDPRQARGISAITPVIAEHLGVGRGLVCLDPHIADYHARDADRDKVILELQYSQLTQALERIQTGLTQTLYTAIDETLAAKNAQRQALDKPPLKAYFRDFARLQEITKVACRMLCNEITIAQTSSEIHTFSVTSFYTVSLELGLIEPNDIVRLASP